MMDSQANFWSDVLAKSCPKTPSGMQGTVICVGQHCGKSSPIRELCRESFDGNRSRSSIPSTQAQSDMLLSYCYYDCKATRASSRAQRIHLWTVHDAVFDHFHAHLDNLCHLDSGSSIGDANASWHSAAPRLAYVIELDMSAGAEAAESLHQWLVRVHRHAQHFHTHIGAESSKHAREAHVAYLSQMRTGAGKGAESSHVHEERDPVTSSPAARSFGVPIIVCACKCDTVYDGKGEAAEVREVRDARYWQALSGQLRAMCLEAGAALISAFSGDELDCNNSSTSTSSRNGNIDVLSQYIAHRLFPEHVAMRPPLAIAGSVNSAFAAAGLDSDDAIFADTGHRAQQRGLLAACQESVGTDSRPVVLPAGSEPGGAATAIAVAEDEHLWLGDLQGYIEQATTGIAVAKGSAAELALPNEAAAAPALTKIAFAQSSGARVPTGATRRRTSAPSAKAAQQVADFFTQLLDAPQKR